MRSRRVKALVAAGVVVAGMLSAPIGQASAGTLQSNLVGAVPGTNTPNIANGTVYAITQVGTKIIVGGSFTSVMAPGSKTNPVTRSYLFAFDATTGTIDTAFVPALDAGPVEGLTPGVNPNTVYVAGKFNTVNGVASKSVVLLDTLTGQIVPGWAPSIVNGEGWPV